MASKDGLRNEMKHVIRALSSQECQSRSLNIESQLIQHLISLDHQSPISVIGLYLPLRGEPSFERGRWKDLPWRRAYPSQSDDGMKYLLPKSELPEKGHWIAEGEVCEPDIIVVPGLAFSADGYRLGRGGGFYDRLLANWRPKLGSIGVCFEEQLCSGFEVEAHDKKLDVIITDSRVINCGA